MVSVRNGLQINKGLTSVYVAKFFKIIIGLGPKFQMPLCWHPNKSKIHFYSSTLPQCTCKGKKT